MTAAHLTQARSQPAAPQPNWTAIGVLIAVLVHAAALGAFGEALVRRVAAIEAQIPPGSIQVLQERTLQIQKSVGKLEARG